MSVCRNEKGKGYFNAAYLTKEDFAEARRSWRKALCGDETTNDLSDPVIRQMLELYEKNARETREKMNRGESIPILFGSEPPVESEELAIQYGNIRQMALAYGTYGCESYHSPELLNDIIYALDWMEANMYGAEVLSDTSFRSYLVFNWWYWYIGGAVPMLETVMIIEESLTREQIDRYVLPMSFLRTQMRLGNDAEMAVGQILPCTPLALLTDDKALLQSMYLAMGRLLEKHEEGENMRADWCCMTHGIPYNLGYGQSNLHRVAYILQILSSTPLDFPLKDKYNLMEMVRYCFAPAMWHGRGLQLMNGRGMQLDNDADPVVGVCSNLRFLFGVFGEKEDEELFTLIRRHATPYVRNAILGYDPDALQPGEEPKLISMPTVGLTAYTVYKKLLLEEHPAPAPYELAYMWRSGDSCVWHHNDVCFGLRMNSERVFGYECINHLNMDGWYTGDGHLYVYLPGQDLQYSLEYWRTVDKYHIPGVTADTQEREVKSIVDCFAYFSDRAFTGGTALDGRYLTAAMDFRSFHNDHFFPEEDIGYGAGMPLHDCSLEGHKAWFFFENAVAALGAGIRADDGFEVHTTVENRLLSGKEKVYLDGDLLRNTDYEREYKKVRWLCVDGVCGYVFPDGADLVLKRQTNENGHVFLTCLLNHGVSPRDAKYAYVLLPMADKEKTESFASSDGLRIASLTEGCLAAEELSSGLAGYAFFEAGECGSVRAETPLILMTDGKNGRLSVCDPTQKRENVRFRFTDGRTVSSDEAAVHADEDGTVTVDTKDACGKTFTAQIKKKKKDK